MVDATQRQWQQDFDRAANTIPAAWIWTDPADGWQGIDETRRSEPIVEHYASLCRVGYARGWL